MIIDAAAIADGILWQTDLCIVGGGAAGITLAMAMAGSGRAVLLLEAGRHKHDAAAEALSVGSVENPAMHSPAESYRRRILGGATTIWGGRCVPFDPMDFEPRPWLGLPGWPIGAADLTPFYASAAELCDIGPPGFSAGALPGGPGLRPMFSGFAEGDVTTDRIERFSLPTNFADRHAGAMAADSDLTVILGAVAADIALAHDGGRVTGLEVATLDGRRFKVSARHVVLAGGGLEIPRLLLASTGHAPAGVGNAWDQVGRHYMCHIAGTTGAFTPRPGTTVWHGYDRSADGVYLRRRLSISAAAQARTGMGNAIARLHHPRIADPSHLTGGLSALFLGRSLITYEYAKRLASAHGPPQTLAHLRNMARDPIGTASFIGRLAAGRLLSRRRLPSVIAIPRAGVYQLDLHAEQLPNPQSRIRLQRATDALGMPRLHIDWRWSAADMHTVCSAVQLIADALQRGGHGSLRHDHEEVRHDMLRDGAYGGHHIGTARMSVAPRDGVVDGHGRVHGIANLFVAGSAVFPTSGQANPTFTIVALTLRLAAHLRRLMAQGPADQRLAAKNDMQKHPVATV